MMYTQGNYSLRRFLPADWALYKAIRLEALQADPQVFGSNFDKEFEYPDQQWRDILENPARAFFGLFEGRELIGCTGIATLKENERQAILVASYIRREHRGKKLSRLFYQARLDWAKAKGFDSVIVSHRVSNEVSKAANQRFGFTYTHTKNQLWPDGVEADQLYYELKLA